MKLTSVGVKNFFTALYRNTKGWIIDKRLLTDRKTLALREKTCRNCSFMDRGQCQICECFVDVKVKLRAEKCPLGFWE